MACGLQGKDRPQKADFSLKQVVLYMVSMSSMWILIIATGADTANDRRHICLPDISHPPMPSLVYYVNSRHNKLATPLAGHDLQLSGVQYAMRNPKIT